MRRRQVGSSLYAGGLLAVLGVVAWVSGQPFVFPSLGPSAFVLAFERDGPRPRRVVGGHVVGAVAGLFAYGLLATGGSLTTTPAALSTAGLRLAASGVGSVVLTSLGMSATDTAHAPACATTLIVSLGLLSTPREVGILVLGVVGLVAVHAATRSLVAGVGGPAERDAA